MAILASGATMAAAAGSTAAEATASLRHVRVTICNNDSVQHTYHVQVGAVYVKRNLVLAAVTPSSESRTVGPFSVASGESLTITKLEVDTAGSSYARFVGESYATGVLASGTSITAAGSTATENTTSLRYVRVAICNADTIAHRYHVQVGAQYVRTYMSLQPDEDRGVGPFSLTAAETMIVTKVDAGVTYSTGIRFIGEVA